MFDHPILNLLLLLLIMYLLICLYLYFFQRRFIYFPSRRVIQFPVEIDLPYEDITYQTGDGVRISAWFLPAEGFGKVILFFHGNAGNISHRLESLMIFNQLGMNVFIIDYRGYGKSSGFPSEAGTYQDARGAWDYLVREKGFKPADIVLFGRSLGGSIAAWLARETSPAGLIIESVFKSIPEMGRRLYPFLPVRLLSRFSYDTESYIKEKKCPLLVVHSPEDEMIPFSHGIDLYNAAPQPKYLLKLQGSHNEGFMLSLPKYSEGLDQFLTRLT